MCDCNGFSDKRMTMVMLNIAVVISDGRRWMKRTEVKVFVDEDTDKSHVGDAMGSEGCPDWRWQRELLRTVAGASFDEGSGGRWRRGWRTARSTAVKVVWWWRLSTATGVESLMMMVEESNDEDPSITTNRMRMLTENDGGPDLCFCLLILMEMYMIYIYIYMYTCMCSYWKL